jgi:hypothetical protein
MASRVTLAVAAEREPEVDEALDVLRAAWRSRASLPARLRAQLIAAEAAQEMFLRGFLDLEEQPQRRPGLVVFALTLTPRARAFVANLRAYL